MRHDRHDTVLPPTHPDQPEDEVPPFPAVIPDEAADHPAPELVLRTHPSSSTLPLIVLGCAPFGYGIYADKSSVQTAMPLRLVRLALRAGINAFDTSPHYHPSEIVLGHALAALRDAYPRASYQLITKAGKYGARVSDHVYDPAVVRRSVERSLRRLQTDYLDVSAPKLMPDLHDVEFVASAPFPVPAGDHVAALEASDPAYHLDDESPVSLGPGDDAILACLAELRALQAEGKVRRVGLAGYPLPTLLRLARLAAATPPHAPIDIVQTYASHTVLTPTLAAYLPAFAAAHVGQVVNAAPLAMGILTAAGGPAWHPAKTDPDQRMYAATRAAVDLARQEGTTIEEVAIGFGYRTLRQPDGKTVPVVVGCTDLAQLQATLQSYHAVNGGEDEASAAKRQAAEDRVMALFEARGVKGLSWQSPAPSAFE